MTADNLTGTGWDAERAHAAPVMRLPAVNGMQDADSPGVEWYEGRPWCSSCQTPLNAGTTVGMHGEAVRAARVPVCPMGCSS